VFATASNAQSQNLLNQSSPLDNSSIVIEGIKSQSTQIVEASKAELINLTSNILECSKKEILWETASHFQQCLAILKTENEAKYCAIEGSMCELHKATNSNLQLMENMALSLKEDYR